MKLVAIWVEDYMTLKNQGLNFGDELFFSFSFNKSENKITINAEKTNEYYNLFETSKIKNITGILGSNGSGKTSILKLLNVIDADKPITKNVVLIFKKGDKYSISKYAPGLPRLFPKSFDIILSDELLNQNLFTCKFAVENYKKSTSKVDYIFYSSLFSNHNDSLLKEKNDLNISVDYLARKSLNYQSVKKYIKDFEKQSKQKKEGTYQFDLLNLYFAIKNKRQYDFLIDVSLENKQINDILKLISLPKSIDIVFDTEFYEEAIEFAKQSQYDFPKMENLIKHCTHLLSDDKNLKTRFKNEMTLRLFLYAFKRDLFNTTEPHTSLQELVEVFKNIELNSQVFESIYNYLIQKKSKNGNYEISILNRILRKIHDNNYRLDVKQNWLDSYALFLNYYIDVDKKLWSFMDDFNKLFIYDQSPFIKFKWHGLSAGQDALLTFFAELWGGLKHVKKNHVIVNIDEGELYLHPEWQRNFVNLLYKFLEHYMTKNSAVKSYQVIITSHSPFIASDIPAFNLIILKNKSNSISNDIINHDKELENQQINTNEIETQSVQNTTPTFAGNILELYADSFYLNDSIGEFSKTKIQEILTAVFKFKKDSEKLYNKAEYVNLHQKIKIIGDTAIRQRLFEMLLDSVPEELSLVEEYERTRDRLEELAKKLGK